MLGLLRRPFPICWHFKQGLATFTLAALTALTLIACDPDGHKQCAWVLEPETKLIGTTTEGYIPVCARNRETMKEDCRLQTPLDFAEKVYGRKFRYVDLRVKSTSLPRTIDAIKFCDGKS